MPKKSEEALSKHTLLLFEGDFPRLQELYPEVGATLIIRRLIRKHLLEVDPKTDTSYIKVSL